MISLSMGGKGVCSSSGPTFVGVVRPEVVVAVSTLSRSSLERWVNVDCMIEEEIFGCVLVVVLQRAVRGKGALVIVIGSAFHLGTESCLRCAFRSFESENEGGRV